MQRGRHHADGINSGIEMNVHPNKEHYPFQKWVWQGEAAAIDRMLLELDKGFLQSKQLANWDSNNKP